MDYKYSVFHQLFHSKNPNCSLQLNASDPIIFHLIHLEYYARDAPFVLVTVLQKPVVLPRALCWNVTAADIKQ